MAIVVPSPNILLAANTDKVGRMLIELKNALVATGLWRVRGSGDGASAFQLMGQTAGVGGSYDVFTSSPGYATNTTYPGPANTISRGGAWYVLEEIGSGRCLALQRGTSGIKYLCGRFSLGGVASSGANATTVPAAVGTSTTLNSSVNGGGSEFWANTLAAWDYATEVWCQIGVSLAARASGVCPFYLFTFRRSNSDHLGCVIYESVSSPVAGETHPLALSFTRVGEAVGVNGFTQTWWVGGATLAGIRPCGFAVPTGASPTLIILADSDGKWRTKPVEFRYASNNRWLGSSEHYFVNTGDQGGGSGRTYPNTYFRNDLTKEPRLVVSYFLVPWKHSTIVGDNAPSDYTDLVYELLSASQSQEAVEQAVDAAVDDEPPAVTIITPQAGATITADTEIFLGVSDEQEIVHVFIWARYDVDGVQETEVVYDSTAYTDAFSTSEVLENNPGKLFAFTIRRNDGWRANPSLVVIAIDKGGNIGINVPFSPGG